MLEGVIIVALYYLGFCVLFGMYSEGLCYFVVTYSFTHSLWPCYFCTPLVLC